MRLKHNVVAFATIGTLVVAGAASASGAHTAASVKGSAAAASGVGAAKALIEPFIGHAGPFPVTQKLKRIPKGAVIDFVGSSTPVTQLTWGYIQQAAKTMGVKVKETYVGNSPTQMQQAFNTVIAQRPQAVIVIAVPMDLWARDVKPLKSAGVKVVPYGVVGAKKYGFKGGQASETFGITAGKLQAAYVVANWGPHSNIVYYETPELPFASFEGQGIRNELHATCPGCTLRTVAVPIADLGTTAPSLVVSDLQANPSTTAAIFSSDEAQTGLPAKLTVAGITKLNRIGVGPTPINLQYIKTGQEPVALGLDQLVSAWVCVDEAAREIVGQKLTGLEAQGVGVMQFLGQTDVTASDVKNGWTGYSDYKKRFEALWGVHA